MQSLFFHGRRLLLSYLYQGFLMSLSWALSIKKPFMLVLYFSLACILCGIGFAVWPDTLAAVFHFNNLDAVARTDIQSYYGTMLIALGVVLAAACKTETGGRVALMVIAGFAVGSAAGRIIGFIQGAPVMSIHGVLVVIESVLFYQTVTVLQRQKQRDQEHKRDVLPILNPKTPEEFQPLSQSNFTEPFEYYRMLRDHYPVYKMPGKNFYCISRFEDIQAVSKDTAAFSSKLMEILVRGRSRNPDKKGKTLAERLGELGVVPVDVLALQDPPTHKEERKVGHSGFNAHFVKSLEKEVEDLCDEMMDEFLPRGNVEFVQDFAWRLPMRLIIRLLGLPEDDFEQIKYWCMQGIRSLSGTASRVELIEIGVSSAQFTRYLWKHYLEAKKNPPANFTGTLIKNSADPDSIINDQRAIAIILQLLIAGSDSSASSMGSAVRVLAREPELEKALRAEPDKIPLFIEEVFRTESAFQGHFRVTTREVEMHGVTMPAGAQVFLMWASGNRDERFWDNPDVFDMHRRNVKKHLTFGFGVHACIGRELARMEIRIVLKKLLEKTSRFAIVGDSPYEASIFARTLLKLPLAFEVADKKDLAPQSDRDSEIVLGKEANNEKEAEYVSI